MEVDCFVECKDYPVNERYDCSSCKHNRMRHKNTKVVLQTDTQQAKHKIKPTCSICVWHNSGSEACGDCKEYSWWQLA